MEPLWALALCRSAHRSCFSINSDSKIVDNTPTATNHFINFLSNFLNNNPWDLIKNPLYIAGESYAGHYIPAFA
jgi:carboxypeptidase C (cathepsin A)